MDLEARQGAMSSPSAAHLGPAGHVSVSSENPGLESAYSKISLGTGLRPRWSGKAADPQESHRSPARGPESRPDRASG